MAIDYTTLFGDLAEIVSATEEIESMMSTVETRRASLISQMETTGVLSVLPTANRVFDTIMQSLDNATLQLRELFIARLSERDSVLEQLPALETTSINDILYELGSDMVANSETIKESTVTITDNGTTATNTNVGDLITTKKLPGNIQPGNRLLENRVLAGEDCEMSLDDNLIIKCIADAQGGAVEGAESWVITGNIPATQSPFEYNAGGNPGSTNIQTKDGNLITNFFENFTSSSPDNWTMTGTAATDFDQETTEVYLGSNSLKFIAGQSPVATYDIYSSLVPGQVCCLFFYLKREATSGGTLDVDLVVNGSDVINDSITIDSTYDDWALVSYVFTTPDNLGTAATLALTGAATTDDIYIDGGGLCPMVYHAGTGYCISQGSDRFLLDDYFSVDLGNDDAGKFQRYFGRAFGFQLNSATSTSETISEPS